MEIRTSQSFSQKFFQSVKHYTDSLLSDDSAVTVVQPFIMPIQQVERFLHEHYVSQQPLTITFEYFNKQQQLVEKTITARVNSTIRYDRRIVLQELTMTFEFLLSTEQILRVKKY